MKVVIGWCLSLEDLIEEMALLVEKDWEVRNIPAEL